MVKQNKYAAAAKKAQQQTDEEYQKIISGITHLTAEEVEKLFPQKADTDKLMELMALVNSGTNENQKILKLKENSEKFGLIAIKLLKLLV
jgi:benzoyl-CoA reductase/2-hydroxyglutaryl-CoA dehydratase subunit BcrC/BadD/HgdB